MVIEFVIFQYGDFLEQFCSMYGMNSLIGKRVGVRYEYIFLNYYFYDNIIFYFRCVKGYFIIFNYSIYRMYSGIFLFYVCFEGQSVVLR